MEGRHKDMNTNLSVCLSHAAWLKVFDFLSYKKQKTHCRLLTAGLKVN